jgi:hypothetical protein
MKYLFVLFGLRIIPLLAQQPISITSIIHEVTVFPQGAEIFESAKVKLVLGKNQVRIHKLSPFIDPNKIKAYMPGEIEITSIQFQINYLADLKANKEKDSLAHLYKRIETQLGQAEDRQVILKEKWSLLDRNKNFNVEGRNLNTQELASILQYYENEITKIKKEERTLDHLIDSLKGVISNIPIQEKAVLAQKGIPSGEILIKLNSKQDGEFPLELQYLVLNAGWFPKYDIRVQQINSPLELTYKAEFFQNTGVDWKDVKLKFSNLDPQNSGTLQKLEPWYLNYARHTTIESRSQNLALSGILKGKVTDGSEPIVGATIRIVNSQIGTISDVNGGFELALPSSAKALEISYVGFETQVLPILKMEMNIKMIEKQVLEEVVVSGMAGQVSGVAVNRAEAQSTATKRKDNSIETVVLESMAAIEIQIEQPYTLISGADKAQVDLKQYIIPAEYDHISVPKLDQTVYLVARIYDWEQYQLLQGEANIFYENSYVGKSILDPLLFSDTLNVSMGPDKNVQIKREKITQDSRKKWAGSNAIDKRMFKILVKNNKSQPVSLTIVDQIPVSVNQEIEVSPLSLANDKLEKGTGLINWRLKLDSKQSTEINFGYEVKRPKRELLYLE